MASRLGPEVRRLAVTQRVEGGLAPLAAHLAAILSPPRLRRTPPVSGSLAVDHQGPRGRPKARQGRPTRSS